MKLLDIKDRLIVDSRSEFVNTLRTDRILLTDYKSRTTRTSRQRAHIRGA
jgi:hypothetical protein